MSQLAETIVCETKLVVRETGVDIESLLSCNSDLELVLRSGISDYLPVMDTSEEGAVRNHSPEVVVSLIQKRVSIV